MSFLTPFERAQYPVNGDSPSSLRIQMELTFHLCCVPVEPDAPRGACPVRGRLDRAIVKERQRLEAKARGEFHGNHNVLFSVRVDDYIFKKWEHERKIDVTKKVVADARNWTDPSVYAQVRDKLISDLKAE
jgi:hypothetical protein